MAYALALVLGLAHGLAWGQAEKTYDYQPLGDCGLVTRYSRGRIPPHCLQEARNLLFDEDGTASRRQGYTRYNQTACTDAKKVRGLWVFDATDNTRYLVINSSTSLFYSAGDGTCTQIGNLTLSDDDELDCVATIGRLWCTNGADTGFSWNGASTRAVAGMPAGTLIGAFRNRVITANVSGALTRLRLSGELDGEDWTVQIPGVSTTPANIDIAGTNDGARVTCLLGEYQNAYIIGRDRDLWALGGYSRDDFTLRKISSEIGCIDDRTVQESNNSLIWLSRRGVEQMTGANIQRISDPIRSDIDVVIEATQDIRSAIDTTQGDFEAGNLTAAGPGAALSADDSGGDLLPGTTRFTDTTGIQFAAGTLTNISTTVLSGSFTVAVSSSMELLDNFGDGDQTSAPAWTAGYEQSANTTINTSGNKAHFERTSAGTGGNHNYATRVSSPGSGLGTWATDFDWNVTNVANVLYGQFFFMASANDWDSASNDGYMAEIRPVDSADLGQRFIALYRVDNGVLTRLAKQDVSSDEQGTGTHLTISRSSGSVFRIISSGDYSVDFSYTDSTYAGEVAIFAHHRAYINFTGSSIQGEVNWDNFYRPGRYATEGRIESSVFDTGFSTPVASKFDVLFSTPDPSTDVDFQIHSATSANGVWNAWVDVSSGDYPTSATTRRYIQYAASVTAVSTITASVSFVDLSLATTGQFYGQCRNPGSTITGWRRIECDLTEYAADWQLYIATGASCHAVGRATAPWTAHNNNAVVSVPTANFFAWRGDVTFTHHVTTGTPLIRDCQVSWVDGASRPPSASAVYKDRYMLFYTTDTATDARNEFALVYDQNKKWTKFDNIAAYSAVVYSAELYTGDAVDSGRVYTQDVGQNDDGGSYTYSIKTADTDLDSPTKAKVFKYAYMQFHSEVVGGEDISATASYYVDGSTTSISLGAIDLGEGEPGGLFTAKLPFPASDRNSGHRIAFGLNYTGTSGPIKLLGIRLVYVELEDD